MAQNIRSEIFTLLEVFHSILNRNGSHLHPQGKYTQFQVHQYLCLSNQALKTQGLCTNISMMRIAISILSPTLTPLDMKTFSRHGSHWSGEVMGGAPPSNP